MLHCLNSNNHSDLPPCYTMKIKPKLFLTTAFCEWGKTFLCLGNLACTILDFLKAFCDDAISKTRLRECHLSHNLWSCYKTTPNLLWIDPWNTILTYYFFFMVIIWGNSAITILKKIFMPPKYTIYTYIIHYHSTQILSSLDTE